MDRITFRLDADSADRIDQITNFEFILYGVTVMILLIELLFVFMPTFKKLNQALANKDLLFREMHHRIKNNLNMISSLLFLKQMETKGTPFEEYLKVSRSRIATIAEIHQYYLNVNQYLGDEIDVKEHYSKILPAFVNSYAQKPERIDLELEIDEFRLNVDLVVYLGFLLNELITNIIKHAYCAEEGGKIKVELKVVDQGARLSVTDYGKGYEPSTKHSDGQKIIDQITDYLEGKIETTTTEAVTITVLVFPLK